MMRIKRNFLLFLFFSFFLWKGGRLLYAEPAERPGPVNPVVPQKQDLPPAPPAHRPPHLPPAPDSDIMHYRGSRVYSGNQAFEISQIKCKRIDEKTFSLHITFNQSLNPRSVGKESIFLNGQPLPENIRFAFNRRGDTIKLLLPQLNDSFKLLIQKISSFDGKELAPIERLIEVEN